MMNLKQFSPIVPICAEIKWPGVDSQQLYLIVVIINNQVLRKIKIVAESDVKNWAYISLR